MVRSSISVSENTATNAIPPSASIIKPRQNDDSSVLEVNEGRRQLKRQRERSQSEPDIYVASRCMQRVRTLHAQGRSVPVKEIQSTITQCEGFQFFRIPLPDTQPVIQALTPAQVTPMFYQYSHTNLSSTMRLGGHHTSVRNRSVLSTPLVQAPHQASYQRQNEIFGYAYFEREGQIQNQYQQIHHIHHIHHQWHYYDQQRHQQFHHQIRWQSYQQYNQWNQAQAQYGHQHGYYSYDRYRGEAQYYQHQEQPTTLGHIPRPPTSQAVTELEEVGRHITAQYPLHRHDLQHEYRSVHLPSNAFMPTWQSTTESNISQRIVMTEREAREQEGRDFLEAQTRSLQEYKANHSCQLASEGLIPSPPKDEGIPGFTRSPMFNTVCVACDNVLSRSALFVRQCGHVYCRNCATSDETRNTGCKAQHCKVTVSNTYLQVYL